MPDVSGREPVEPTTPSPIPDAMGHDPTRLNRQPRMGTDTTWDRPRTAPVGSQFSRVQSRQSQNTSNELTMKQNLTGIESNDVIEVLVKLEARQIAFQTALAATARAFTPSLTEFLR
jgi:hypothetical protein